MIPQTGNAADRIQAVFFNIQRLLPSEWASWLGSFGIRANARLSRPDIIAGARANLRRHRPDASDAELDRGVDEFLDGVGRVAGEFAVMHRFLCEGRIETSGLEAFKAVAGTRPILALCVHTGNWETYGPVFQQAGIPLASIIQPPESAYERLIVQKTREQFNVETIEPDAAGIRKAVRVLRQNRTVSMFPDEARQGVLHGPLFGRPPHDRGNLAVAARLARMTGASLAVGHCRRTAPCRFRLTFGPLFEMPRLEGGGDILADVAFLNARIEPLVLENIPRWYFLDDAITPIAPSPKAGNH
jgi:Kdo2-lipid IVA lauroyltransferase/acyltransferase